MEEEEFYAKRIGEVFDRLRIRAVIRNPKPKFVCDCICGGEVTTDVFSVLDGKTRSCGCLRRETIAENGRKNIKPAVKVGEIFKNKQGLDFEILEYVRSNRVLVKFIGTGYEKWTAVKEIKRGSIRDWIANPLVPKNTVPKLKRPRKNAINIGDTYTNFYGCKYEVIELLENKLCRIKFDDETSFEKIVPTYAVRRGIRNPFRKVISGVGYTGVGIYNSSSHREIFNLWVNMITRCYDESSHKKHVTYKDCEVCDEWHNLQVFAEWCESQVQYVQHKDWCLDKDIIVKGNKTYSPETCSFVPIEINNLFTLRGNGRGKYPIGVHLDKKSQKFAAQVNIEGKRKSLGRFISPLEAFTAYKTAKEALIKSTASRFKDELREDVYTSLINWTIEVTD